MVNGWTRAVVVLVSRWSEDLPGRRSVMTNPLPVATAVAVRSILACAVAVRSATMVGARAVAVISASAVAVAMRASWSAGPASAPRILKRRELGEPKSVQEEPEPVERFGRPAMLHPSAVVMLRGSDWLRGWAYWTSMSPVASALASMRK